MVKFRAAELDFDVLRQGVKDKLPRRYLLTFTSLKGSPTWDIRLSKWELNGPVDERLFAKKPAADSHQIQMLKSR